MPSSITAVVSQLHTAALSTLHIDDHPHQLPPLVHDPIGPVIDNHAAAVALNPQPLPPAELGASIRAHLGELVALNPQPLPPKDDGHLVASDLNPQPLPPRWLGEVLRAHRFDAVALNPQPLPPRWLGEALHAHRFDAVALNPQPLPPRESVLLRADEYCGNARHFAPVPPRPGPLGEGEGAL